MKLQTFPFRSLLTFLLTSDTYILNNPLQLFSSSIYVIICANFILCPIANKQNEINDRSFYNNLIHHRMFVRIIKIKILNFNLNITKYPIYLLAFFVYV